MCAGVLVIVISIKSLQHLLQMYCLRFTQVHDLKYGITIVKLLRCLVHNSSDNRFDVFVFVVTRNGAELSP